MKRFVRTCAWWRSVSAFGHKADQIGGQGGGSLLGGKRILVCRNRSGTLRQKRPALGWKLGFFYLGLNA